MHIHSDFALLDVKEGRDELHDHFKDRPKLGPCPDHLLIPVVITGFIDDVWSHDDGTSREFSMEVGNLHLRLQSGTPVFYRHPDPESGPSQKATVIGDVEGWYHIRFSDGSTNIVRPSHLKVIP